MKSNDEIIKEFLTKMSEQSSRCTAAPYFYVIRSEVITTAPLENCDETRYYDPINPDCTYDTEDECRKEWSNDGLEDEEIEEVVARLEEYGIRREWSESGMFLTETDAEAHLEANHYHYTHGHTYVKHSWRAPELEEFFVAMFNFFEVNKGNLDLRGVK